MFDSFKTVKVYCANEEELNNLFRWLYKGHLRLTDAARGYYPVNVVLPKLEDQATGTGNIRGYYVTIPLEEVKPMLKKISVQDAFSGILHPRN